MLPWQHHLRLLLLTMRGLHQLQGFPSSNCTNSAQCPHAAPQAHTTHLKLPPAACCQPCRCSCSCCCWPSASLSCPPPTGPRGPTPTSARPLTTSSPSPRLCSSDRRSSAPLLPAAATCFGVAPPGAPAAAAAEPGVAAAAAARTLCSSWLSLPLSRSAFQDKFERRQPGEHPSRSAGSQRSLVESLHTYIPQVYAVQVCMHGCLAVH